MQRKLSAVTIAFALAGTLATSVAAQTQSSAPQQRSAASVAPPQTNLREVPPEITRRIEAFHSALQPSAKAWVDQQARLEAEKPAPDAPSIESAVSQRFPVLNSRGSGTAKDINALVAMVMMQAVNDAESDLQKMMAQMQATTKAKQLERDLISQLQSEEAAMKSVAPSPICPPSGLL